MKNPFRYVPTDSDVFVPMPQGESAEEPKEEPRLTKSLEENVAALCAMLHTPPNDDIIIRRFAAGERAGALIMMDGMSSRDEIARSVLSPLLRDERLSGVEDAALTDFVVKNTLSSACVGVNTSIQEVYGGILNGMCAILLDGTDSVISADIRLYEKRGVETPQVENVILGPHEAFTENLRTSITQVRRLLKTGRLVTEFFSIGDEAPTAAALLYIEGITNPGLIEEARRRLNNIHYDLVPGAGYLQHLIEDSPSAAVPQMLQTERPDRTAFFLMEGHIAILSDGAPFSLCAPSTLWHLMHAPDDSFMRWRNGTFIRLIRFSGLILSLLLPSLYLSTILFHSEILPMELLVSIAAANAEVPFPMLLEVLLMELSFDLIHEAGTRVPGALGSAIGIIGAIILGQAAVAAAIVSPILIIIVAVTGLGNFAIPDYSFSVGIRVLRLLYIFGAATFGYLGVALCFFLTLVSAGSLTSFGVPWLSPFAPKSTSNRDILLNSPLWAMHRRPSFLRPMDARRTRGNARGWDRPDKKP